MTIYFPSDFTCKLTLKDMQGNTIAVNSFERCVIEFDCLPSIGTKYVAEFVYGDADKCKNAYYVEGDNHVYVTFENYALRGKMRVRTMIEYADEHYTDGERNTYGNWITTDITIE